MYTLFALRLASRALRRRPGYAIVVTGILGLGIGATAAIFSLVDAVLLRPLPYRQAESVVVIFADGSARGGGSRVATSPGDFYDWQLGSRGLFTGLAAIRNVSPRITSLDAPVVPLTHAVTANYFDVLGASALVGRTFAPGDDRPGRNDVVMMSYALWTGKFGADPGIVGRSIDLDGRPHRVVGVMGPDFYSAHIFNVQPDLWIPEAFDAQRGDRATRDVMVYGRLAEGRTLESARAAMRTVAKRIAREHAETDDGWSISLVPIREQAVGGFTRIAALVLIAVGLVLLIACANAANLALARGAERTTDVAVRVALGASRRRVLIELLAESVVLSGLGGVAGIVLAAAGIRALVHLIPPAAGIPFLHRAVLDLRLVAFIGAVAATCAAVSGVLPSRQAGQIDIVEGLRASGRGAVGGAGGWRQALVAVEMALAVVVIVCAGLMARSLVGLERLDPGFRPDRIAKLRTSLRGDAFASPRARIAHFQELQRRVESISTVQSASAVSFEPPNPPGQTGALRVRVPGDSDSAAAAHSAVSRTILSDYFGTMGIPIVAGRGVTPDDRLDTQRVAVISQTMAAQVFAGVDPIGRTFSLNAPGARPMLIVGVCGDIFTSGVDPSPAPTFYVPIRRTRCR